MKDRISEGIRLLGCFRPCHCGSFVLQHGTEAFLLEMPPCNNKIKNPWEEARAYVTRHGLKVKGLLATHAHGDHVGGYHQFRRTFPDVPFFVHRSFRDVWRLGRMEWVFEGQYKEFLVDGEPLYVLHAPKHSQQDMLVFFRGTVCSGDWSLGRSPDCNGIVPTHEKVATLRFVRRFLHERHYVVHTCYSAHANELRRPIDFTGMLDDMADYWQDRLSHERVDMQQLGKSA